MGDLRFHGGEVAAVPARLRQDVARDGLLSLRLAFQRAHPALELLSAQSSGFVDHLAPFVLFAGPAATTLFLAGKGLVSVRRVLESYESSVIQGWWPDSRRGHRCGRVRTAPVTTAASCDIQAT